MAKKLMAAVTGFVMFSDEILQPLVALRKCLLNRGSLTWKIYRGDYQLAA